MRYVFKKRWKRVLAGLFDGIGSFFTSLPFLCRKRSEAAPRKILVVRLDSLGDGVLALPAVSALAKCYPEARIDFLASPPVFALYRHLFPNSRIHLFEKNWLTSEASWGAMGREFFRTAGRLRAAGYDLGIDFRGDLRTLLLLVCSGIPERWGREGTGGGFLLARRLPNPHSRHEILDHCELIQPHHASEIQFPHVLVDSELKKRIAARLGGVSAGKKVVIHIGAGYPSKRWAASRYVQIAKQIQERRLGTPIFIGTQEEKKLLGPFRKDLGTDTVDLTGQTNVVELLAVLDQADLFIGNDSGPAHLAALLDRRMVLIFSGTNDIRRWAPWSSKTRLVNHPVPCSPCEEKVCPLERQYCLEDIPVDQVFRAVEEVLGG
jgi:heptosyltransferase-2